MTIYLLYKVQDLGIPVFYLVLLVSLKINLAYFCSYRLEMLAEASDEIVNEKEDEVTLAVKGKCIDNLGLHTDTTATDEDKDEEESNHADASHNQLTALVPNLVNIYFRL